MIQLLEDKVAVVTGGGRGLGRGYAIELAKHGAKVVVNDYGVELDGTGSSSAPSDEVVAEIKRLGGIAVADYNTVATPEGASNIIKKAIDSFGKIDILVNNAGIIRAHMIHNMTDEDWDQVIKVHLYGTFYCTRAACVFMRQQRSGRIINIVSPAVLSSVGQANYAAAKGGILSFTRGVAMEMGRYGVTANCVCPGAGTRMTLRPEVKSLFEKRAAQGDIVAREALKTMEAPPETNSPLVAFLASDSASNINGACFWITAGNIIARYEMQAVREIYKPQRWTTEELVEVMPSTLAEGLVNPAPPQPPKEKRS